MCSPQRAILLSCAVLALLSPTGSLLPSISVAPPAPCSGRHTDTVKRCSRARVFMGSSGVAPGDNDGTEDGTEDTTIPATPSRVLGKFPIGPLRTETDGSREGLRARLRRRIVSLRDSRRIASFRQLLRNSTLWEEEEWLSPNIVIPSKVLGSARLARTVAIIRGQNAQKGDFAEVEKAPAAMALDESGVVSLQGALADIVLAAETEFDGIGDSEEMVAENSRFSVLIDQWARAIAENYGTAEPHSASRQPARTPLTGPAFLAPAPGPGRKGDCSGLQQWPQLPTLRASLAAHPELLNLTDFDLHRFLVLSRGDASKALSTLIAHHKWLNGPGYGIGRVADVSPSTPGMREQIRTGKCFLLNKPDNNGRPVVIVRVDRHVPTAATVDESTLFIIMCLKEAEARLRDPHSSQFSVALALDKASINNIDYPLIKRLIYILTNFYPERLGVMLLHDAPAYFTSLCWPLIKPWLNPATRDKIHFTSSRSRLLGSDLDPQSTVAHWIGKDCLPTSWGGDDEFDYDAGD